MTRLIFFAGLVVMAPMAGWAQTPDSTAPASTNLAPATPPAPATNAAPVVKKPVPIDAFSQKGRFAADNAKLAPPAPGENRVVFFGDSITALWARDKSFFPGKSYIGRGISGQTTMQMLLRFRADVIDLQPKVVIILAGTNDLAENQGIESPEQIQDDLKSMVQLAQANHITPILCSILPANKYPWRREIQPGPLIVEMNKWIEVYCQEQNVAFVNYYPALVDDNQGTRADLTLDGVHPSPAGFEIMAPLAQEAIDKVLQ